MDSTKKRPVAVVGAGAIGLALASALCRAGRPVVICGRTPVSQISVTEDGASQSWPVTHVAQPADLPEIDTAILAVKAHQTASTASWLQALDHPAVKVLVAQNGVEHRERVAPYLTHAQVIPAVVYLNGERTAPGEVLLRRVGEVDVAMPDSEAARLVATDLAAGQLRVRCHAEFSTVAWVKLLANITANPITALTGRRAEVIRDPSINAVARQAMVEAVQVARAEGAELGSADIEAAMAWIENAPRGATTSMLQDRLAGRPLEFDALTGAVVRAAERHGVDVPVNRLILALVAAIRPTDRHPEQETL